MLLYNSNLGGNDVLSLSNIQFRMFNEENDDETFGEEDYTELLRFYGDGEEDGASSANRCVFPVETDDNVVMRDTRQWVQR